MRSAVFATTERAVEIDLLSSLTTRTRNAAAADIGALMSWGAISRARSEAVMGHVLWGMKTPREVAVHFQKLARHVFLHAGNAWRPVGRTICAYGCRNSNQFTLNNLSRNPYFHHRASTRMRCGSARWRMVSVSHKDSHKNIKRCLLKSKLSAFVDGRTQELLDYYSIREIFMVKRRTPVSHSSNKNRPSDRSPHNCCSTVDSVLVLPDVNCALFSRRIHQHAKIWHSVLLLWTIATP